MPRPKQRRETPPFPLAKVLKRLGVKKYQLFKRTAMPVQQVISLCKGTANPNWKTLMRILRGLGCSLAEFDPKNN